MAQVRKSRSLLTGDLQTIRRESARRPIADRHEGYLALSTDVLSACGPFAPASDEVDRGALLRIEALRGIGTYGDLERCQAVVDSRSGQSGT